MLFSDLGAKIYFIHSYVLRTDKSLDIAEGILNEFTFYCVYERAIYECAKRPKFMVGERKIMKS